MSKIDAASLEAKLKAGVKDVEFISVADTSDGCGAKFAVVIVSPSFDGMSAVERHQFIMGNAGILAEEIKTVRRVMLADVQRAVFVQSNTSTL